MLHVVLWKWVQPNFREVYTWQHVNIVSRMLREALEGMKYRIVCVTDEPYGIDPPTETFPLWNDHDNIANATGRHLPSCYRRLKLFDRSTQEKMGIALNDRIMSIDLDTIIVGSLVDTIKRIHESNAIYGGWGVRGTYHQRVFNGSFWTFLAGTHLQHMWSKFDPMNSPREALGKGFLGSDQGWMSMHFATRSDVYAVGFPEFASYPREVRRIRRLDARTKVVFFHGSRKPWHPHEQKDCTWITRLWR